MGEEEIYDEAMERREFRRARRKRNQLIALIVVVVVGAAIVAGGIFGVMQIMKSLNDKKHTEELQAQLQELAETEPAVVEAPKEETTQMTDEDYLDQIARSCIAEMPLEDKIDGLFMITPEALTGVDTVIQAGETTKQKLSEHPVGGLVYFQKNIKSKEQLQEMLAATKNALYYPVFLAVDEEGGTVSRVAQSGIASNAGSQSEIGKTCDPVKAGEHGETIGTYLSECGFNVNFAPVADVLTEEGTALKDRSFGTDSSVVGSMVAAEVESMQKTGVSACLKHFPGMGDTMEDTHDGKAVSQKTLDDLRALDFPSFQAGISAGSDFVMVGHVSMPNVTGDETPCSLSGVIVNDLLRNELGYDGIVITDALNMKAITSSYSSEQAAVMAIQAGADMLLMPEDFQAAYDGVLKAVQDGTILEERIDESLMRIYRVKYRDRIE